jgi:anti-anti-sigma factor
MNVATTFTLERLGTTAILNLKEGLRDAELEDSHVEVDQLFKLLGRAQVQNIIVDCHEIDFLRSMALGFFVRVWKRVQERDGTMTFCNASTKAREILKSTKLERIWTIYDTREDAIEQIGG